MLTIRVPSRLYLKRFVSIIDPSVYYIIYLRNIIVTSPTTYTLSTYIILNRSISIHKTYIEPYLRNVTAMIKKKKTTRVPLPIYLFTYYITDSFFMRYYIITCLWLYCDINMANVSL